MESYDIIIVGAGIAGLTAALYCARSGKKTLLIEKNIEGGQIMSTPDVENYPGFLTVSGYELIEKIKEQVKKAGAVTLYDNVTAFDFSQNKKIVKTLSGEYEAAAVILAMGSSNKTLGLKGEDALVGSGISYCATCDGAFFKGQTVMVAGSGRTAKTDVEYLSPLVKKVYVLDNKEVPDFDLGNVEKIENAQISELIGSPLKSVRINKNSKDDIIDIDGLFVAVGHSPSTHLVKGLIELDERGYIITNENMQTSIDGVFAAGDIRKKSLRQLVTAASDGAIAAQNAAKSAVSIMKKI